MDNAEALRALDCLFSWAKSHPDVWADDAGPSIRGWYDNLRRFITDPGYVRVPVDKLRKLNGLVDVVEGANGAICHGTWRDDRGFRLKDTAEWASYYSATKETPNG